MKRALAALLAWGLLAPAHADTTLTLRETAAAQGEFLRLGEIADVRGEQAEKLKKIYLAPAPAPGAGMVYTAAMLEGRLRALGLSHGVVVRGAKEVQVADVFALPGAAENGEAATGKSDSLGKPGKPGKPGKTPPPAAGAAKGIVAARGKPELSRAVCHEDSAPAKARRAAQSKKGVDLGLSPATEMAVRRAVAMLMQKEFAGYDIRGRVDLRRVTLPEGDYARLVATQVTSGRLPGRAEVMLAAYDARGQVVNYGSAEVQTMMEVNTPLLARSLNKGDTIRATDVAYRYEEYNGQLPEKFEPKDLPGRECLRPLRSGSRVSLADFVAPHDTRKGGVVMVVTRRPGFEVKERAIALDSGRVGDQIRVQSQFDEKKTYPVRITGPGTAEVVLGK